MDSSIKTLGIMVSNRNQRKSALRRHLAYSAGRIKLICFEPSDIDWERKTVRGLHRKNKNWVEGRFPFPKVVYNRCYNSEKGLINKMEEHIGKNKCFNHINQFNKIEVHQLLAQWLSPHLPETVPYEKQEVEHRLALHKLVYLKPCHGHLGKGVFRVERKDTGEIQISSHYILPSVIVSSTEQLYEELDRLIGANPYLIQKGIYSERYRSRMFDMRVLVQKNNRGLWTATNVITRLAHEGCFNTSMCDHVYLTEMVLKDIYPAEQVPGIMDLIYNISLRSAEIIEMGTGHHLCEISVDLVMDQEGHIWIIEINGKPQKSLYDEIKVNKKVVYSRPIEYGISLHSR
jgi:hypothetical protein